MEFTVLIIDDSRLAVQALEQTIPWEQLGLRLIGSASDGKEGMELIEKHRPDIVLSDIQMPEMDGLTMMERMADQLAGSRVIFITAYEKIEYASRAIKLAAFDFILKPVDNDELCKSLLRAKESLLRDRDQEERSGKNHIRTYVNLVISCSSRLSNISRSSLFGVRVRMLIVFKYISLSSHIASLVSLSMIIRLVVRLSKSCAYLDTPCWSRMISMSCSSLLFWKLPSLMITNSISTSCSINIF